MSPKRILIIFLFLCSCFSRAQGDIMPQVVHPVASPVLRLTENLGQWTEQILFRAQLDGGALYIENGGLTFDFYDKKKYRALHHGGVLRNQYKDEIINCHAY